MDTKIFWVLLTLFQIFFQGSESLSDKSSDRHLRKKRIIDVSDPKDEHVLNQDVRYVVLIKDESGTPMCTGIILRSNIILTAAHCVNDGPISIASGRVLSQHMKIHRIVGYLMHKEYNQRLKQHDLALILLRDEIDLMYSYHRAITLYNGEIPPNSHGLITGWGSTNRTVGISPPHPLSIVVPIINPAMCAQYVHVVFPETAPSKHLNICTFHVNRKKCCWFGDSGGPLTVNGHLVGVFSWFQNNTFPTFPDVFINLLVPEHRSWLVTSVNNIHTYIH